MFIRTTICIVALSMFGCDFQPQEKAETAMNYPFNGVCGSEYEEHYKIVKKLFGDNPTIVVFKD
tara:strand:- start:205 stop:396 length:192 start_codon:yes stop_codon:yes gene_type:complete